MTIGAIIVALAIAFVAWKFVAGMAKFAVIAVIVVALIWFLSQGGLG